MKNINVYISESLHNSNWLDNAKNNEEPFVMVALEAEGWDVTPGSQNEDFQGIDLKVEKPDTNDQFDSKFNIDVKGSSPKNKQSKNFLFTCKSASGKEYPYSNKHFIAFIDYIDKNICIVADKDVKELVSRYQERDSKFGDNSKYVLLPKQEVQKLGKTINPSNKIKNLLK